MGKNTSFSLDDARTALRLLEDRETRLRALRQAMIDGERSGESIPFDFDEFVSRKRATETKRMDVDRHFD